MECEGQNKQSGVECKYDCLLFDLDDTLYPFASGVAAEISRNIQEYMVEKLGIEKIRVPEVCVSLYKQYGTTMAGLRAIGYKFDNDDFHSFVHGRLPYKKMLKPDHILRNLLLSLPVRKLVFTNSDKNHAQSALGVLGLEGCFEGVICFETLNNASKRNDNVDVNDNGIFDLNEYLSHPNAGLNLPKSPVLCKPFDEAYEQVFKITGANPHRTILFDDSIRNIQAAKRLGLCTVLVGSSHKIEGVDYALESIHNIKEALPELWEENEKADVPYAGKVAIETTVKA